MAGLQFKLIISYSLYKNKIYYLVYLILFCYASTKYFLSFLPNSVRGKKILIIFIIN